MKIKFLLLANSSKDGGRCVAGVNLNTKKLIRLIPYTQPYCLPKEQVYNLSPLDVIEIDISDEPAPKDGAQSENYYVNSPFRYAKIGKMALNDFHNLIKEVRKMLPKKYNFYPFDSTKAIMNHGEYSYKNYSIDIIRAYGIKLKKIVNPDGTPKTHAAFDIYKGNNERITLTDFRVTDPDTKLYDNTNRPDYYPRAYLIVTIASSPDKISNLYYKFIATIIPF